MLRTQIYLTSAERKALAAMAKTTGKKQSELIREAVDQFLNEAGDAHRTAVVREAAGMWRGRDDLPDFGSMRKSWERG